MFSIICGWVKWGKHRGAKPDPSFSRLRLPYVSLNELKDFILISKKVYSNAKSLRDLFILHYHNGVI